MRQVVFRVGFWDDYCLWLHHIVHGLFDGMTAWASDDKHEQDLKGV